MRIRLQRTSAECRGLCMLSWIPGATDRHISVGGIDCPLLWACAHEYLQGAHGVSCTCWHMLAPREVSSSKDDVSL